MSSGSSLKVKIWGARGSIAGSSPDYMKYGGNSSCVEVRCGSRVLVLDAGSGIRFLGNELSRDDADKNGTTKVDLLFTHCHHDHICGLPFFFPLYSPEFSVSIWSGHLQGTDKTRKMCESYMSSPFFPVGPEVFKCDITYSDFSAPDTLSLGDGITVKTIELDHHDGCVGYRVEYEGRSVCYITDVTHQVDSPNLSLIDFIRGSNLVIYDATFSDDEFVQFSDYGHSTWQEGVRLCIDGDVLRYCIFHHRPARTDAQLDEILLQAREMFESTDVAYEGLEYSL